MLLTTVLSKQRQINPPKHYYIVKHSKSMATDKCNFGRKMADRVRSASNTDEIEDSSNWFTLSEKSTNKMRPVSAPCDINPVSPSHSVLTSGTSERENMQFLTKDGGIVSSSSARTSGRKSNKQTDDAAINGDIDCSKTGSNLWQPLSVSALSDYQGVKERVLSGHGKFDHGSSKLWKNKL